MIGKHHCSANFALACFGLSAGCFLYRKGIFPGVLSGLSHQLFLHGRYGGLLSVLTGISGLWLGAYLPDCDMETSAIGRYFHIPVEHRTWTHSVWFLLLLAGVSAITGLFLPVVSHVVLWTGIGCFLHIFVDSLSRGGICWFYPLSQYKMYSSGARIKPGQKIKLYYTGKDSEKTTLFFLCFASYALSYFFLRYVGWSVVDLFFRMF